MEVWQFGRAAIAMSAYDEAREKGEKHSVAVRDSVTAVRCRNPEVPISETGMKRILSKFRPRRSRTILRFERSRMSEEEIRKYRSIREWDQASTLLTFESSKFSPPHLPCRNFPVHSLFRPPFLRIKFGLNSGSAYCSGYSVTAKRLRDSLIFALINTEVQQIHLGIRRT